MTKKDSPKKILNSTVSLTEFKEALYMLLLKYKRPPMTEEDYRVPVPLAVLAFKDGQTELIKELNKYLKEPDNG